MFKCRRAYHHKKSMGSMHCRLLATMSFFLKNRLLMIPYLVGMESLDKRGYFRLISIKTMPNILYINTV